MTNVKIKLLQVMMLVIFMGCSSVNGTSNNPLDFSQRRRLHVDDCVEILAGGFFKPEVAMKKYEAKRDLYLKATGSERDLRASNEMNFLMANEMADGEQTFYSILLNINPGVNISVRPGAFTFVVEQGDTLAEYTDKGLCMRHSLAVDGAASRRKTYSDSGQTPFLITDKFQPNRPGKWPIIGFLRLPAGAEAGRCREVRIDDEKWTYSGPGVKKKPQWK